MRELFYQEKKVHNLNPLITKNWVNFEISMKERTMKTKRKKQRVKLN